MDPEEPQPLPPPMMAATPSSLPPYLSNLSHFGDSQSDSSSDDDEEDYDTNDQIPIKSRTKEDLHDDQGQGESRFCSTSGSGGRPARSLPLAHSTPLSTSPEHKTGHVSSFPQEQISLLELAGDL